MGMAEPNSGNQRRGGARSATLMRIVPLVLSAALAAAPTALAQSGVVEQGQRVFAHLCAPCHGAGRGDDGAPMLPGTHALTLKYRGEKPGLLEERTDLSAELIGVFVRNGVASMPPFRKTELSDEDIAAIATYLAATATLRNRAGVNALP
jgi:mono/diheme cytochrome c family protein